MQKKKQMVEFYIVDPVFNVILGTELTQEKENLREYCLFEQNQ